MSESGRLPMTTRDEVFARIVQIIAELEDLDPTRIQLESQLEQDLGMDSLSIVELQMAAEEAFGVTLPETETPRTVASAVDAILAASGSR